ncbi:hypothetical protein Pelo_17490 [Pelomyxa schiedti]|nr:hypothetical protein Pelo_17490 [Pelomyxa schiedti]
MCVRPRQPAYPSRRLVGSSNLPTSVGGSNQKPRAAAYLPPWLKSNQRSPKRKKLASTNLPTQVGGSTNTTYYYYNEHTHRGVENDQNLPTQVVGPTAHPKAWAKWPAPSSTTVSISLKNDRIAKLDRYSLAGGVYVNNSTPLNSLVVPQLPLVTVAGRTVPESKARLSFLPLLSSPNNVMMSVMVQLTYGLFYLYSLMILYGFCATVMMSWLLLILIRDCDLTNRQRSQVKLLSCSVMMQALGTTGPHRLHNQRSNIQVPLQSHNVGQSKTLSAGPLPRSRPRTVTTSVLSGATALLTFLPLPAFAHGIAHPLVAFPGAPSLVPPPPPAAPV